MLLGTRRCRHATFGFGQRSAILHSFMLPQERNPISIFRSGCPCPESRRSWPAEPWMAERRQRRTSEGQDGRSECPAKGPGHTDPRWTSANPAQNRVRNTNQLERHVSLPTAVRALPAMAEQPASQVSPQHQRSLALPMPAGGGLAERPAVTPVRGHKGCEGQDGRATYVPGKPATPVIARLANARRMRARRVAGDHAGPRPQGLRGPGWPSNPETSTGSQTLQSHRG